MEKRGVYVYGLIVFFCVINSILFVSSCEDNQTILKLSHPTNAHLALWNTTDYEYEICFPNLFGYNYTGNNSHPKTCTSPVIWIEKDTNSHGATTSIDVFTIPICFGNLSCRSTTQSCLTNERDVLHLDKSVNTHVSDKNDPD